MNEVLEGGPHGVAGEVQPVAEDVAVGPERPSVLPRGSAWNGSASLLEATLVQPRGQ